MLQKIEAIIEENRLDPVAQALFEIGIGEFSVVHRRNEREMQVRLNSERGTYQIEQALRVHISIVVNDYNVEPAIAAICGAVGESSEGLITVYPIHALIRTGPVSRRLAVPDLLPSDQAAD